jgi:pyridoxal phosphate enzyme (YggS family)
MNLEKYKQLNEEINSHGARLVAVSKTKPAADILTLYQAGQKLFGENKAQELESKYEVLPHDIEWHFIGHLQSNKVKDIAPFVSLIHSVDSLKVLQEIDKQAAKNNRVIDCLLQIFIATEETKFGLNREELYSLLTSVEFSLMKHVRIRGFMGMATNTADEDKVENEFAFLKTLFDHVKQDHFPDKEYFNELSMGMSADYKIALKHGATLIRIGSIIFGERE